MSHHYLIEELYTKGETPVETTCSPPVIVQTALAALEQIKRLSDIYWSALSCSTRDIVFFRSETRNSFASLSGYGASFVNLIDNNISTSFLIEDIVHQSGHIIFSSIDATRQRFLAKSADTALDQYTDAGMDHRTIYTALHGLFTEAMIAMLLDKYSADINGGEYEESIGRLSFILGKFGRDLNNMRQRDLYTHDGWALIQYFRKSFDELCTRRGGELQKLKLGDQGYTFNLSKYLLANRA